jgi:hypothetical protein
MKLTLIATLFTSAAAFSVSPQKVSFCRLKEVDYELVTDVR